jgi:MazG family protein
MKEFDRLVEIMNQLRDPNKGCPWDLKQTQESLRPRMIEEVYEIAEAISENNKDALKEELGDLLLHIVFQAKIAEEKGDFNIQDIISNINQKLIRRHPHIFKSTKVQNAKDVEHNWEKIKREEKSHKKRKSILEGLPKSLPSLIKAARLQSKAASVGFDWDNVEDVFAKLEEEVREFKEEYHKKNHTKAADELGDILFAITNIARKLDIDPEFALNESIKKFIKRFNYIENSLKEDIFNSNLKEMDQLWEKAKHTTGKDEKK